MKKQRKEVHLDLAVIKKLAKQADGRSLKNYMEHILIKQAEK